MRQILTTILPVIPNTTEASKNFFLVNATMHQPTMVTGNKYTTAGRRNIRKKSQKKAYKPKRLLFDLYNDRIEYNKKTEPVTTNVEVPITQLYVATQGYKA